MNCSSNGYLPYKTARAVHYRSSTLWKQALAIQSVWPRVSPPSAPPSIRTRTSIRLPLLNQASPCLPSEFWIQKSQLSTRRMLISPRNRYVFRSHADLGYDRLLRRPQSVHLSQISKSAPLLFSPSIFRRRNSRFDAFAR